MPSRSTLNQVSLRRPGTASIFTPKAGIAQEWITSCAVVIMRMVVSDRHARRGCRRPAAADWPGLRSASGIIDASKREVAVVGIFVGPVPLMADRLDGQVGLRDHVLDVEQPERRDGDDDQDQDRHHRPDHLDQRVVRGARRRRVGAFVEAQHADQPSSPSTNTTMSGDDDQQRESWKLVDRARMIGVAGCLVPILSHGSRLVRERAGQSTQQRDRGASSAERSARMPSKTASRP